MKYLLKYPQITLMAIGVIIFCLHLDVFPVKIMEARNFVTAREMIVDGNWLLTTLNGQPRYEKPPLPAWLSAVGAAFFGIQNTVAYRLPISLMSLLTALVFYRFVLRISQNKEISLMASLILITSFYYMAIQREAPVDIFAHGFMLASVFFLYRLFKNDDESYLNAFLAGLFSGFSLLSKGPVSHYAMLLPFLAAYVVVYPVKNYRAKVLPTMLFIVISLISGGWWYLLVRVADPGAFTTVISKETENWGNYHVKPFYYYWNFFAQSGMWTIPALISLWHTYLKNRVTDSKLYRFAWLWTIFAVILLSLIPEKKPRYLFPVLIPLAITIACYIEYLYHNILTKKNKYEQLAIYLHYGIITLIACAIPLAAYIMLKDSLNGQWVWIIAACTFSSATGIALFRFLLKRDIRNLFYTSIFFYAGLFALGFPLLQAMYDNREILKLKTIAREASKNNMPVYSLGELAPELIWAFGKKATPLNNLSDINLREASSYGVLARPENESELFRQFEATHVITRISAVDMNRPTNLKKTKTNPYLLCNYYILTKKSVNKTQPYENPIDRR